MRQIRCTQRVSSAFDPAPPRRCLPCPELTVNETSSFSGTQKCPSSTWIWSAGKTVPETGCLGCPRISGSAQCFRCFRSRFERRGPGAGLCGGGNVCVCVCCLCVYTDVHLRGGAQVSGSEGGNACVCVCVYVFMCVYTDVHLRGGDQVSRYAGLFMNVCAFAYIYIYIYIYICVCVCVYIYIYIYIHTHACTYTHTYMYVFLWIYMCKYTPTIYLANVFECICMYVCTYTRTNTHIQAQYYIYIYIYIHTQTHTCIQACTLVCTQTCAAGLYDLYVVELFPAPNLTMIFRGDLVGEPITTQL
jgi:hypothetical protein